MNKLTFIFLFVFLGGVFLTSKKFVNETNTPKFYFVFLATLVVILLSSLFNQRTILHIALQCKAIFKGIIGICFLQSFYGILQLLNWFPSNNANFALTGSFDNPAGFAAVLAIGFPIGLSFLLKTKNIEKYVSAIILLVVAIAVLLSGSRTGVLAIIVSTALILLNENKVKRKFRQLRSYIFLSVLTFVLFVSGIFFLYNQKKDSATGRLLIWEVSTEMIKDKPVLGHGFGAFKEKYMTYQAKYFKNNFNSKFTQLADNVKHPFNEFIKVAVEFGIVGLIVVLSFFSFVLWKIVKSENENRVLVFSGLVSFLVCAFFSYPLQYIAVWLLLAFYLFELLPQKEIRIKNTHISIVARLAVVAICVFFLLHVNQQIRAELKWKTIAVISLRGKTEEMLPEYERLYSTSLKRNPFFLYNYGAELNHIGKFDKSIDILTECQQCFNDYDLQMLLADNYSHVGDTTKAIELYKHAGNMIPCRFLPLYNIFEIYKTSNQNDKAFDYATKIINKKVKVPSATVHSIKIEAQEFIDKCNQQ